jgi:hypothetical protein
VVAFSIFHRKMKHLQRLLRAEGRADRFGTGVAQAARERLGRRTGVMTIRTQLKAGTWSNHNEPLLVRSTLKAGALRRKIRAFSQEDRLRLLLVRAGLKAGKARRRQRA